MGYHRPLFDPNYRTPESRKPAYLGASGQVSRVGLEPTTYGLKDRQQYIRIALVRVPKLW